MTGGRYDLPPYVQAPEAGDPPPPNAGSQYERQRALEAQGEEEEEEGEGSGQVWRGVWGLGLWVVSGRAGSGGWGKVGANVQMMRIMVPVVWGEIMIPMMVMMTRIIMMNDD